jgi:hypothetical protein
MRRTAALLCIVAALCVARAAELRGFNTSQYGACEGLAAGWRGGGGRGCWGFCCAARRCRTPLPPSLVRGQPHDVAH